MVKVVVILSVTAALGLATAEPHAAALPSRWSAHYTFEHLGDTALDVSPPGPGDAQHHAINRGATATGGYHETGVSLDGKSWLAIQGFRGGRAFTVAAWVRTTHSGQAQYVVSKGNNYEGSFYLRLQKDGRPRTAMLPVDNLSSIMVEGPHPVNDGRWHHLAAMMDGQALTLYVDGRLVGALDFGMKHPVVLPVYERLTWIGSFDVQEDDGEPNAAFFLGEMDDVRLLDAPVPAQTIAEWARRVSALDLDPGGFSVDLGTARAETPVTGQNLLRNGGMEDTDDTGALSGWRPASYVWLPTADAQCEARMRTRLRPYMKWQCSEDKPHNGKLSAALATPREAFREPEPAGHEFCAYYHQSVTLPALEDDRKFVLSYHCRGRCEADVPNSRPYVRVTFYDSPDLDKASQTRTYAQTIIAPSQRWRRRELPFVAPRNTRRLDVRIAFAGCGEAWFDDVALQRTAEQTRGPTVRLMPWALLDNLYCLSSGDADVMVFGFRNESSTPVEHPHLLLQLPPGIDVIDLDQAATIVSRTLVQAQGRQVQQYRVDIKAWKSRIRGAGFRYPYNMWEGLALLLRTSQPAAEAWHKCGYWLEDGEYRTEPRTFHLQIVPAIPATAAPKLFRSGAHLFLMHRFSTPEGIKAFASLYDKVGFNAVHVPPSELSAEFGRLGIERYTQPFSNGYTMGDRAAGKKPDTAVFRLASGEPIWEAICPVEVYTRGPYFRSCIENDTLRRLLVTERQAEQVMANWEPFMYCGKGCFCERCRKEFESYSKLPRAEMDRAWPTSVLAEHRETWITFRAWQHGKLMTTLEQTVNAVGKEAGLDSHFIPEIHHRLLTDAWDKHEQDREYAAVDYLGKLPVLEPWAPYNWFVFGTGPYEPIRGQHLSCHATARSVQAFLATRLPEPNRPRLIAFPYGTYEGATQPEAIVFEILTYFLNGYHGAFVYLFPGGYDARYWRALPPANRLLARFEPFVYKGKRIETHKAEPVTPLPKPDPRVLSASYGVDPLTAKRWQDLALLQSWEFERAGARLIAVGNFWEQAECFFRLALQGLDSARRYVLHEPNAGRCYASRAGDTTFTAQELTDGVLLHVGAMRYAFFVLEQSRDGVDYGTAIRPQQMENAMQDRLEAIRSAGADEE